jgi:hypothetical protein
MSSFLPSCFVIILIIMHRLVSGNRVMNRLPSDDDRWMYRLTRRHLISGTLAPLLSPTLARKNFCHLIF